MDFKTMFRGVDAFKARFADLQKDLEGLSAEGRAGGGLVVIRLGYGGRMLDLTIDPDILSDPDADILRDLIKTAHDAARENLDALTAEKMGELSATLPFPIDPSMFKF